MSVIVTAQQPFFLPDYYYFHRINQADIFIAADFLKFRKQSPIVRTILISKETKQYLTIPIQHQADDPQPPLNQIKLHPDDIWRHKHLRTMESLYGNYPFFEHYFPLIVEVYERPFIYLVDFLNELSLLFIKQLMPSKKIIIASKIDILNLDMLKRWLDHLAEYSLLIDQSEEQYYHKNFTDQNYILSNQHIPQSFSPFYHPRVTIIALLFQLGPEIQLYFKS